MHASRGVVVTQADACWGCVASAHGDYVGIACVGLPAKTHCSAGFDSHERFLDVLEQVNDSYRGTLSSYCYVLMCIHLLQQRQPPILPCLHSIKPPTLFRCAQTTCMPVAGSACRAQADVSRICPAPGFADGPPALHSTSHRIHSALVLCWVCAYTTSVRTYLVMVCCATAAAHAAASAEAVSLRRWQQLRGVNRSRSDTSGNSPEEGVQVSVAQPQ